MYPLLPVSLDCLSTPYVLCTQCYQFLWIGCLHLMSCLPNVASFSGLSSPYNLCTQCCQFLWIVCLRLMSCVPNVASFSGLFVFALCLVYPKLPVSLDCLSSPYVLCTQCCQFLWIVCLRLMSCVPNVTSFSGLVVFTLCLVYPMLPVSLDCLHLITCVPNVVSFSGLFVFALCLVYPMLPVSLDCLSSPYVLCTQSCQFLWIVCLRLMSCVPNVASFSGLFFFALCLVYPMLPVSLDCLSSPYVLCTQCCRFLWIVCLHLMSCVPNVASFSGLFVYTLCPCVPNVTSFSGLVVFTLCLVYPMLPVSLDCLHLITCVPNVVSFSGLFVFALCLVYPMLPVSLDCLSSPYVLCTQSCQFLWIVCLRLMSCVPNVASFSGLFFFALCLVYPMLPVSLDCLSSPYVLCTQCCRFLWIVFLHLMSCVPNVASFSGLSSPYNLCTQCCQLFWIVCLRLMSCVPNVVSFSGLFVFALCLVYPMLPVSLDCLSSPYVLCTQSCQFLWIVCLRLMSCVPNVASFSGLFFFALCLVYPKLPVSLDCLSSPYVLCTQCCQFLWIVCLRLMSCVPNVAGFSGLFVFVLCLVYPMLPISLDYLFFALCLVNPMFASFSGLFVFALCLVYLMLPVSLDCLSSPYVLCTQCCQFLWIVCLRLMSCVPNVASFSGLVVFTICLVYPMLQVSLDCLHPISCVPNVANFSGLFVFALCLVYPILPVSLDCLSSPYVLCTQCYQFLWIVCLRLMSCVPNVASFSGLFVFVLCLVYPMLPVSLDCLSSPYVLCTQCCQFLWIVFTL